MVITCLHGLCSFTCFYFFRPTVLDNFALLSGQISSLNRILRSEKTPAFRNFVLLPLVLAPEKDPDLAVCLNLNNIIYGVLSVKTWDCLLDDKQLTGYTSVTTCGIHFLRPHHIGLPQSVALMLHLCLGILKDYQILRHFHTEVVLTVKLHMF